MDNKKDNVKEALKKAMKVDPNDKDFDDTYKLVKDGGAVVVGGLALAGLAICKIFG